MRAETCVFRQFMRTGCAGAVWMRGGSLDTSMGAGRRCLATRRGPVTRKEFLIGRSQENLARTPDVAVVICLKLVSGPCG